MKLKDHLDPKYTQIAVYVIATFGIIFLLIRFADNIPLIFSGVVTGIRWLGIILTPILWGFALAYILSPVCAFVKKRMEKLPLPFFRQKDMHAPAVAVTMIGAILLIVALLSVVISLISNQVMLADFDGIAETVNIYLKNLNGLYHTLNARLEQMNVSSPALQSYLENAGDLLAGFLQNTINGIAAGLANIGSILTSLIFVIIFAVYFLLDGKPLARYWGRVLRALTSEKFNRSFLNFVNEADRVFSGYIRGQLSDAFIMAVLTSIGLSLAGIRYAVLIGILTGIGNLIPYVGPIVGYGSTAVVCLLNGDIRHLVIGVLVLFVIQTVDGNIINPRLLSSNIDVHPMLVIAALLVGSAVGGLLGMLLAVPVAALLKIIFDKSIDSILKRRNLLGEVDLETEEVLPAAGDAGETETAGSGE